MITLLLAVLLGVSVYSIGKLNKAVKEQKLKTVVFIDFVAPTDLRIPFYYTDDKLKWHFRQITLAHLFTSGSKDLFAAIGNIMTQSRWGHYEFEEYANKNVQIRKFGEKLTKKQKIVDYLAGVKYPTKRGENNESRYRNNSQKGV